MNVFYVFQNTTFKEEYSGGYIWCPKKDKNGNDNAGYKLITEVKKGDFILHHFQRKVVAISLATSDYEDATQPVELKTANKSSVWNDDGYTVYCDYLSLTNPVQLKELEQYLIDNYSDQSAFTKKGTGKQVYLSRICNDHLKKVLFYALELGQDEQIRQRINEIISSVLFSTEYDEIELDEIASQLDTFVSSKINSTVIPVPQDEMQKTSTSTGGVIKPVRDTRRAAEALMASGFVCEFNQNHELFLRKSMVAYTESHHLIPISKYKDFEGRSLDVHENIVSLCSHCHNLLHYGRIEDKEVLLRKLYDERVNKLKSRGLNITFDQLSEMYR